MDIVPKIQSCCLVLSLILTGIRETKQTSSKHQAARKRFVSMRSHTANRSSAAGEDL